MGPIHRAIMEFPTSYPSGTYWHVTHVSK